MMTDYARISVEDADELLVHALQAGSPEVDSPGAVTDGTCQIFRAVGESERPLSRQDIESMHGALQAACGAEAVTAALHAMEAGYRAGLTVGDVAKLVEQAAMAEQREYPVRRDVQYLGDVLRVINSAEVNPSVTRRVFDSFQSVEPRYRQRTYSALDRVLLRVSTEGVSQATLMEFIDNELREGQELATVAYDLYRYGYNHTQRAAAERRSREM